MSEIIDLTKNSISNCNLRQHAFFCKYVCVHCFDDLLHTSSGVVGKFLLWERLHGVIVTYGDIYTLSLSVVQGGGGGVVLELWSFI